MKFTLRQVLTNPGFTAVVVLAFAFRSVTTPATKPVEAIQKEIQRLQARLEVAEGRNRMMMEHLVFAPEVAIEDYAEDAAKPELRTTDHD